MTLSYDTAVHIPDPLVMMMGKIQTKTSELKKHLLKYNIEYFGDAVYLGYNSPYQMVDRRNEVALRVKYK